MMKHFGLNAPVIVGAGLGGLVTAIEMSPNPCLVINAGKLGGTGTSTDWAQGGLAAAIGSDDSCELHAQDTLVAGAGLSDEDAVRRITAAGPAAVDWLVSIGAHFDRRSDGTLKRGLEGAHSRRRIIHSRGDQTGAELLRAVTAHAQQIPSITIWEKCLATRIVVEDERVTGLIVKTESGELHLRTNAVVLATGGVGGLFTHTTNPLSSRGQGLALAYRAGAMLRDLEMVQFHPTAMDVGIDPMPLVSEAVRGEGAILVNETGRHVLKNPLAARDVVSRAEWRQLLQGHRVFLDARTEPGDKFPRLFPQITEKAKAAGLNPTTELIPVSPAAHYHMGGVQVNEHGQSTLPGLFAVGEVSSTGLHGANRLASNSLLEAVVCGRWTGAYLGQQQFQQTRTLPQTEIVTPGNNRQPDSAQLAQIRSILTAGAGVLREEAGLRQALTELEPWLATDAGLVASLIVTAALQRKESRGGHTRLDYPTTDEYVAHTLLAAVFDEAIELAQLLEGSLR